MNESPPEVQSPGGNRASTNQNTDAQIIDHVAEERKGLARLKALGALNGLCVFHLADGSLLVTRSGMARSLPDDVRALAQFFAHLGVAA